MRWPSTPASGSGVSVASRSSRAKPKVKVLRRGDGAGLRAALAEQERDVDATARARQLRRQADDGLRDRAQVRQLAPRRRELEVDRQRVLDPARARGVAARAVEVDAAGEGEQPAVAGQRRDGVGLAAPAVARQPPDGPRRRIDLAQVLAADVDDAALRSGARRGGGGRGRDRREQADAPRAAPPRARSAGDADAGHRARGHLAEVGQPAQVDLRAGRVVDREQVERLPARVDRGVEGGRRDVDRVARARRRRARRRRPSAGRAPRGCRGSPPTAGGCAARAPCPASGTRGRS